MANIGEQFQTCSYMLQYEVLVVTFTQFVFVSIFVSDLFVLTGYECTMSQKQYGTTTEKTRAPTRRKSSEKETKQGKNSQSEPNIIVPASTAVIQPGKPAAKYTYASPRMRYKWLLRLQQAGDEKKHYEEFSGALKSSNSGNRPTVFVIQDPLEGKSNTVVSTNAVVTTSSVTNSCTQTVTTKIHPTCVECPIPNFDSKSIRKFVDSATQTLKDAWTQTDKDFAMEKEQVGKLHLGKRTFQSVAVGPDEEVTVDDRAATPTSVVGDATQVTAVVKTNSSFEYAAGKLRSWQGENHQDGKLQQGLGHRSDSANCLAETKTEDTNVIPAQTEGSTNMTVAVMSSSDMAYCVPADSRQTVPLHRRKIVPTAADSRTSGHLMRTISECSTGVASQHARSLPLVQCSPGLSPSREALEPLSSFSEIVLASVRSSPPHAPVPSEDPPEDCSAPKKLRLVEPVTQFPAVTSPPGVIVKSLAVSPVPHGHSLPVILQAPSATAKAPSAALLASSAALVEVQHARIVATCSGHLTAQSSGQSPLRTSPVVPGHLSILPTGQATRWTISSGTGHLSTLSADQASSWGTTSSRGHLSTLAATHPSTQTSPSGLQQVPSFAIVQPAVRASSSATQPFSQATQSGLQLPTLSDAPVQGVSSPLTSLPAVGNGLTLVSSSTDVKPPEKLVTLQGEAAALLKPSPPQSRTPSPNLKAISPFLLHQRAASPGVGKLLTPQKIQQALNDFRKALIPDVNGNVPLHDAVLHENLVMVRRQCMVLKARQKSLDVWNRQKLTPLHLAIQLNSSEIVSSLLSFGAMAGKCDPYGNTTLHLAVMHNSPESLEEILKHNISLEVINSLNDDGYSALHLSVTHRKMGMMVTLINNSADKNLKDAKSGKTALFHAVESGEVAMVELLLNLGVKVNIANYAGHTPLAAATNKRISSMLINKGATIAPKDY